MINKAELSTDKCNSNNCCASLVEATQGQLKDLCKKFLIMNDPSKRIDVEKSSLLSLKAELLRKQEEVLKNKKVVPAFVKHASKKVSSSIRSESKKVVGGRVTEVEDSSLISKSRKILEAKAKYYDRMVKNKGSTNGDDNSLVLFNKKTQLDKSDSDDDDEM